MAENWEKLKLCDRWLRPKNRRNGDDPARLLYKIFCSSKYQLAACLRGELYALLLKDDDVNGCRSRVKMAEI